MMVYTRFIRTELFSLGANIYLADVLLDILLMVSENQEESLTTALLVINNSDHCYLDQYVDTPIGITEEKKETVNEDDLFLKMINTISNTLIHIVNNHYELFDDLVSYLIREDWVDIKGLPEGVIVYYGARNDFNPHISGTKTLPPHVY